MPATNTHWLVQIFNYCCAQSENDGINCLRVSNGEMQKRSGLLLSFFLTCLKGSNFFSVFNCKTPKDEVCFLNPWKNCHSLPAMATYGTIENSAPTGKASHHNSDALQEEGMKSTELHPLLDMVHTLPTQKLIILVRSNTICWLINDPLIGGKHTQDPEDDDEEEEVTDQCKIKNVTVIGFFVHLTCVVLLIAFLLYQVDLDRLTHNYTIKLFNLQYVRFLLSHQFVVFTFLIIIVMLLTLGSTKSLQHFHAQSLHCHDSCKHCQCGVHLDMGCSC